MPSSGRDQTLEKTNTFGYGAQRTKILLFGLAAAICLSVGELFWTPLLLTFQKENTDAQIRFSKSNYANSNLKNVEYNSGVFGQELSVQEKQIEEQCIRLRGDRRYTKESDPLGNKTTCFGPLATNTTCCYCFLSRDDEPVAFVGKYKYWSCAAARRNSLLPLNATNIDTKGGKIAWITGKFGYNGRYKKEVDSFCQQVKAMNLFDPEGAFCYWDSPDYVLRNKKFERHLRYRERINGLSKKGAGFWFHKSLLLRHHMERCKDGDFLVYTDLDRIDFFETGTFGAVIEFMTNRGSDLALDIMDYYREDEYNKEDVFAAFNASKSVRESPQFSASSIVIRNSQKMKLLIDAYVDCVADWHMLTDEPSVLPNAPIFKSHRHDQSILSLLVKTFMVKHAVVGPPARPYFHQSDILAFKVLDGVDPTCPFSAFRII